MTQDRNLYSIGSKALTKWGNTSRKFSFISRSNSLIWIVILRTYSILSDDDCHSMIYTVQVFNKDTKCMRCILMYLALWYFMVYFPCCLMQFYSVMWNGFICLSWISDRRLILWNYHVYSCIIIDKGGYYYNYTFTYVNNAYVACFC